MKNKNISTLVTTKLKLKLNEQLFQLAPTRIEYGYRDEIMICFYIQPRSSNAFRAVTEEDFVNQSAKKREIGVFGKNNPSEALTLLINRYPNALIVVRKDPEDMKVRKVELVLSTTKQRSQS